MPDFTSIINRSDVPESLLPDQVIQEIIQESTKESVLLTRGRIVPMSARKAKQPVLSSLPEAYWVNGDTGLKQAAKASWRDIVMTAEELAVLVPIPNSVIDDSNIPLWPQVLPLIAEAFGKKVDAAGLFGTDKPSSWPTAVIPAAIAAGNAVRHGENEDLGADVAALGKLIAQDGFAVNGFASMPGMTWELIGLRTEQGVPVYTPSLSASAPSTLYGYALNESMNGAWDADVAELLAADWSKLVVGVRQDVTYQLFDQAVINDDDGKVVFNTAQQDSQLMRAVFRVGFQVANPLTRTGKENPYPAGVITPA